MIKAAAHKLKNGNLLHIREAQPEDAEDLLEYLDQVSSESDMLSFGPGESDITQSEEADFLRQYQQSGNQLYLLSEIEDRIVSTLIFTAGHRPRTRHSGEFSMSVNQKHWGYGIGSLMLDRLLEWATDTHIITKINLRVRPDNERAIHLYENKGFKKEGTISREMLLDGIYYDHHYMGLQL